MAELENVENQRNFPWKWVVIGVPVVGLGFLRVYLNHTGLAGDSIS
jgi:hypothetical protein